MFCFFFCYNLILFQNAMPKRFIQYVFVVGNCVIYCIVIMYSNYFPQLVILIQIVKLSYLQILFYFNYDFKE